MFGAVGRSFRAWGGDVVVNRLKNRLAGCWQIELARSRLSPGGVAMAVLLTASIMAGCSANQPPAPSPLEAGLGCVDDSLRCRNHRKQALETLLADSRRTWIRRTADASAYASGVRLFAYKKKKRELTCSELTLGQREAKAARPTLRAANERLTPGQIARGAMLGDEVGQELARERRRRGCKA